INDSGVIAGIAPNAQNYSQAFTFNSLGSYKNVSTTTTPTNVYVPGSIISHGVVVGSSTTSIDGQIAAFIDSTSLTSMGLPSNSVATGINNLGQIVGYVFTNGFTNAFVFTPSNGANGVVA